MPLARLSSHCLTIAQVRRRSSGRRYIPKVDGGTRPLGIPTAERGSGFQVHLFTRLGESFLSPLAAAGG
jgi:hypothetical protein